MSWVLMILIVNGAGRALRVDHVGFNNKRNCLEALRVVKLTKVTAICLRR